MPTVKAQAQQILRNVARDRTTITYGELAARLSDRDDAPTPDVLPGLLRAISSEEDAAGRGMLSAVVVRASGTRMPGGGFFRLAADLGRDVTDRRTCWSRELARVYWANGRPPSEV